MRIHLLLLMLGMLAVTKHVYAADTLIKNVVVYDGTGKKPFKGDVRVRGDRIAAVKKHLTKKPGETVRDEHGMALSAGFIDMHSHHDQGIFDDHTDIKDRLATRHPSILANSIAMNGVPCSSPMSQIVQI
jgi:cytosine/adenosine deaminase-related metal-dependent hydrolase